jgi:AcrR family transcriptional regulator
MEAVAEAADAAKGTLYRYFASQGELVATIREEYAASLATVARRTLLETPSPPAERWVQFAEAMLDFSTDHHALFRDEAVSEDGSRNRSARWCARS